MSNARAAGRNWFVLSMVFFSLGVSGVIAKALRGSSLFTATQAPTPQTAPVAPPSTHPTVTPPPEPVKQTQNKPASAPQPVAVQPQIQPAPRPPAPEPIPPASVKQIGNNSWRVVLSYKDGWFDTGIPVIANCFGSIENQTPDGKLLCKIHPPDRVFFLNPWSQFGAPERDGWSPDYKGTICFKVDTEGQAKALTVIVQVEIVDTNCLLPGDPVHQRLHEPARAWFEAMRNRIAGN